jgi:dimethylargininase
MGARLPRRPAPAGSRKGPSTIAMTRKLGAAIARCELTHLDRRPIDLARAVEQHSAYERTLAGLGCALLSLPEEPELPDSVFVEDTAVVLDELAVITRPGAASRRGETSSVARALAAYRPLATIAQPGTLDGGDVLHVGHRVLVGLSGRTNGEGIEQLRTLLSPHGFTVEAVQVTRCLHLKSAATQVAQDTVLLDPALIDPSPFAGFRRIEVDPGEPGAANALWVGEAVVYPAAFPRTASRLERAGIRVCRVEASEIAKAEGGVTCCSLIFEA